MVRQFLAHTWELPQTLLGWVMTGYFWATGQIKSTFWDHDIWYVVLRSENFTAIACGGIVLMSSIYYRYDLFETIKKHEYGHTRQSLFLGPFYLIVVGIPSLFHYLRWVFFPPQTVSQAMSYHDFWIERWANELGGVTPFDLKKFFLFYSIYLP